MSAAELALARALSFACLSERHDAGDPAWLRALLERSGVAEDDIAAIEAAPAGLWIHRALVRNGLSAPVARMLPQTRDRMNAACAGRFDRDFARFVAEVGPRTHRIRDVPLEFVEWATPEWHKDVPAYLVDLARLELATCAIESAEDDPASEGPVRGDAEGEIALDRGIAFSRSMRLLRFDFAVHALESENAEPARRDVRILGYRDPSGEVRLLEVSPLAAEIVEGLSSGASLEGALASACRAIDAAIDPGQVAALLSDLSERGVLLGAL